MVLQTRSTKFFWKFLHVEEVIWKDQITGKWRSIWVFLSLLVFPPVVTHLHFTPTRLWDFPGFREGETSQMQCGSPIAFPINSHTGFKNEQWTTHFFKQAASCLKRRWTLSQEGTSPWNMQTLAQSLLSESQCQVQLVVQSTHLPLCCQS